MNRTEIQERLAKAMMTAENPAAVFCIEPLASVARDGGERLGRSMSRLTRDPDRAFVIATTNAFIFGFDDQLDRNEDCSIEKPEQALVQSDRE